MAKEYSKNANHMKSAKIPAETDANVNDSYQRIEQVFMDMAIED